MGGGGGYLTRCALVTHSNSETLMHAHLNWEKCQEELYETVDEFTAQLVQKFGFTDSDSETELQLEHMFLLMSRPDHNPGDSCN